jgi:hypothetical protein
MPGTAERRTWRGGAGRPERAAMIGTRVMARAGREAAKKAATTESTMAAATTNQGRAKVPMTWWAFCSRLGR